MIYYHLMGIENCIMTKEYHHIWDKKEFRTWLKDNSFNSKLSTDIISRCIRIERNLNIDLIKETSTIDSFSNLLYQISKYSESLFTEKTKVNNLRGVLYNAVKVFARYSNPNVFNEYTSTTNMINSVKRRV